MGSSLGFGSFVSSRPAKRGKRAIHTRFPSASVLMDLDKEDTKTRWVVLQKARGHPDRACAHRGLPLFVSIWFQVLFHCPHRAAFHLSLAVLVHYR